MNKFIVIFLMMIAYAHAVNVSFSPNGANKSSDVVHIVPGSLPHTFQTNQMNLDPQEQTFMTLFGTADEEVSFTGNWEYDKSFNGPTPDWNPLPSDVAPFKLTRNSEQLYKIRCTTKPAYPLTVSSVGK